MSQPQPAILAPVPSHGLFLTLAQRPGSDPAPAIERLRGAPLDEGTVLGFGVPLLLALGASIPELRAFPAICGPGCAFPSTQGAIWGFFTGTDPGAILRRGLRLIDLCGEAFRVQEDVVTFKYGSGRDLTGYEDGTENPTGENAVTAALLTGRGAGLDGSSFVAAQRWVHDLPSFERLPALARDHVFGRHHETNEELADAPVYAHVKRAAQESFDPPAFMVRRSMPWGNVTQHGLYFVAFGASLDPFERVLGRMAGLEDGITDGLLRFAHAISGGYYWCPPTREGRLDLRAIHAGPRPA